MKKTKRMIALILTFMLIMSILAIGVSARATCSRCGGLDVDQTTKVQDAYYSKTLSSCSKVQGYHTHTYEEYHYIFRCRSCNATMNGNYGVIETCRG